MELLQEAMQQLLQQEQLLLLDFCIIDFFVRTVNIQPEQNYKKDEDNEFNW